MKRSFLILALALLAVVSMQAAPVDVNHAKALGVKFMKTNTAIKSAQDRKSVV